jgi:MYXO-CTERM domain-containing protein
LAQSANLQDWTAAGDVVVDSTSAARLTTAYKDDFSDEGVISAGSALLYYDLETELGLPSGVLAADTFEGSGLRQSFVSAAGATVQFSWQLSTVNFDAGEADRAFVLVDGSTLIELGTVASQAVSGQFSHHFANAGAHDLAVLVMDVNTADRVSTLTLSNFNVTAVPEPGQWALWLAGLASLGLLRRRRA